MDSVKQSRDDGFIHIQRLDPDKVDIVLGAHPRKRRASRPAKVLPYSLIIVFFATVLVGLCAGLLYSRLKPRPPVIAPLVSAPPDLPAVPAPELEPEPAVIEARPAAVAVARVAATPAMTHAQPNEVRHEPSPAVQPLDECLKNGNVIDERVLNCRFGQVPRASDPQPAKGMVSAGYMADFKSDLARANTERPGKPFTLASVSFRAIDSRTRYRADFRIFNNQIENSSVCMNFPKGSVENRECRRAAVVFFKESCAEWRKRASKDHDEQSKLTQVRYCEAMSTFEPG
jgi:hypothetical protein